MKPVDPNEIAQAALVVALALHARNYPHEKVTKTLKERLLGEINDLVDDGMTDKDFLASFSINRARHQ